MFISLIRPPPHSQKGKTLLQCCQKTWPRSPLCVSLHWFNFVTTVAFLWLLLIRGCGHKVLICRILFMATALIEMPLYSSGQSSGDLRLVARNGQTSSSLTAGRLEVYYNGQWGTVCDNQFGTAERDVACRDLGFSAGGLYDTNVGFSSTFATR